MKLHVCFALALLVMFIGASATYSQQAPPNPEPDRRYKVDILEVVGHPDDDIEVAAYVAKLIEQQQKRVAVVYTTRGNSGGNAAGPSRLMRSPTLVSWRLAIRSLPTASSMPGSFTDPILPVPMSSIPSNSGVTVRRSMRSFDWCASRAPR
jgi:hypothetical protein